MKHQTTTRRALALRKTTAARKRQRGFALEWIVIVFLVIAALVPIVILLSRYITNAGDKTVRTLTDNDPASIAQTTAEGAAANAGINSASASATQAGANVNGFNGNGGGNGGD